MTAASAPLSDTTTGTGTAGAIIRDGAISGVVAAAAVTALAVGAKAAGVEMMAAPQTASAAEDLPMAAFAMSTLMSTALGVLLALALNRWTRRPAATFVVVTVVLTVVSFAGPITTGFATLGTRLVLEATHVVAAAIIIPAIARRLPAAR
jgi:hypothetical protein